MRLTIPRRLYTYSHLEDVGLAVIEVYKRRSELKGYEFDYESPMLRHFTSTFKPVKKGESIMYIGILALIITMYLLDLVLDLVNLNYSKTEMPDNVKHIYDQEKLREVVKLSSSTIKKLVLLKKSLFTLLTLSLLIFGLFGVF